jgi:hypothetical protein
MTLTERLLLLASTLPLAAHAAEFGTLRVTQLANNNNPLTHATPGISLAMGPGSSAGGTFENTANRGDYNMSFGNSNDATNGVLLSSLAQRIRNDSATGGPATADFFATSSSAINGTGDKYWIAIHWAEVDDSIEVNYNTSYAYLPFNEFLGGVVSNSVNNGEITSLTGSPGIALGTHFTDLASPAGHYSLDLDSLVSNASQVGVLLVTGAKNEDNFALSRANANGTFDIFCHDSGANGTNYENDGVGFAYLPVSAVGTNHLAAIGRVNGNASTDVTGGNFTVTKGGTGQWYLQIAGHSEATGTLIVSPEGGGTNNIDNILASSWDAANNRWIVESRDLTGTAPQVPALQNMANIAEDAFSFAFFSLSATGENHAPTASVISPASEAIKVPVNAPLRVAAGDVDGGNLQVTFHGRRVAAVEPSDSFSVVALPDTQFYSENVGGDLAAIFSAQTDWIVAERDAENIGFVLHLGDITQHGDSPTTAAQEWANASNAMYRLENPSTTNLAEGVPYIMAVGNHDQTPIGNPDGSSEWFNRYFGVHPDSGVNHFDGKSYYGGTSEPSKADNNYTLFTAGGIDFIVISFEYDTTPDTADLNWADALLKAHPARRGIVITHHTVNTGNPATFSAQGSGIYEALKDNPNLVLMHGGHIHGEGRRSDTFQGRTIHSLLADYQGRSNGGDGWLRIMKFRPSLNRVDVQTYSPTLDQYETDGDSRFSLNMDLSSGMGPFTEIGQVSTLPGEATVTWTGLEPGTRYEWYATVSDGIVAVTTPVQSFITDGVMFEPRVELTAPVNGTVAAAPANLTLQAEAFDIDGTIDRVEFYRGTTLIGQDNASPYSVAWNNVPSGSYTLIAKAIDNEGNTGSAIPVSVIVVTEPAAPDPSTASTGIIAPAWQAEVTSGSPRNFSAPGTNAGDIELKVNGTAPAFNAGLTLATSAGAGEARDNLTLPYASGSGKAWVSVLDNSNDNASDANPATAEESERTAVAYLPYSGGWTGASVSAVGDMLSGNLPSGTSVVRSGDGLYTISGLATSGNFLAFANGNGGTDGDNVVSISKGQGKWFVDVRDNAASEQNGAFTFLYIPSSTPSVLSGRIRTNGTVTTLNDRLATLGATLVENAGYYQLTFGDGSEINPSNSALFLTPDSTDSSAAPDNLVSYSASGNSFRIFTQDLPQLNGNFQEIDLRFLVIPYNTTVAIAPAVSIEATDPNGGEYGEDRTLGFTFSRGTSGPASLMLSYSTSGTAQTGFDFDPLPGVIEIPAGESSATLTVQVLEDSAAEGDETLMIALIDGNSHEVTAPGSASGIIHDRPLQAFLRAGGMNNPEADDDADGIPNILEYYFGDSPDRNAVKAVAAQNGSFIARFPRSKSATDVSATVQWSSDLATWHASGESHGGIAGEIAIQAVSPAEEDPETIEAVLTFPGATAPATAYLRLVVAP